MQPSHSPHFVSAPTRRYPSPTQHTQAFALGTLHHTPAPHNKNHHSDTRMSADPTGLPGRWPPLGCQSPPHAPLTSSMLPAVALQRAMWLVKVEVVGELRSSCTCCTKSHTEMGAAMVLQRD